MTSLRLGLFVFIAGHFGVVATGCVTTPKNGDDIGDYDDDIDFTGYIWGQGDTACVYANDAPTGTFYSVTDATASSSGSTLYSTTGYYFSATEDIQSSRWACNLPLDGTAKSWVLVQESSAAGCVGTQSGSQDNLVYTYDTGTNLLTCANGNSSWSAFWDDCPVSDDAYIIEVNADWTAAYPTGCGAECDDAEDCDDDDDCTTDSCDSNNKCAHGFASAGTSCDDGPDYECDGAGNCEPPACDSVETARAAYEAANCTGTGDYACQLNPWGTAFTCHLTGVALGCTNRGCFTGCASWLQSTPEGSCGDWRGIDPGVLCDGGGPIDCQ